MINQPKTIATISETNWNPRGTVSFGQSGWVPTAGAEVLEATPLIGIGTLYLDLSNDALKAADTLSSTTTITYQNLTRYQYARIRFISSTPTPSINATLTQSEAIYGSQITGNVNTDYNVMDYGAVGDGVTDDTAAIQAAINAAQNAQGTLFIPRDAICLISSGFVLTAGITIDCQGWILVQAGAYPNTSAGMVIFSINAVNTTLRIKEIHIDGNSANQSFTNATSNTYYKAISADGNNGSTNGFTILADEIEVQNFAMGSANPQGLALNTFGTSVGFINRLRTTNVDTTLFVTQASTTTPIRWQVGTVYAHNPNSNVIKFEGFGNTNISKVIHLTDTLPAVDTGADTINLLTTNQIFDVQIGSISTINGRYVVNGGAGGANAISDTKIGNIVAKSCRGSVNTAQFDSSSVIDSIILDDCAIGGISGATVYASLETGGGSASDASIINNAIIVNSANQAVQVNGKTIINSGNIKNPSTIGFVSTAVKATCTIKNIFGYNPVAPAALTIVSGTIYQNTNPYTMKITASVNSTAAGTAQWALGSSSSPATWGGATTTLASGDQEKNLTVPPGWYYSLTVTGTATITAQAYGE